MRSVPASLNLEPMPEDFTCNITQGNGVLKASVIINGEGYEVGLQGAGSADEVTFLKQSIWQLQELARVGRTDLMAYASAHRHTRR